MLTQTAQPAPPKTLQVTEGTRQRVREVVNAFWARGRKGGRPRIMTREELRYAQSLMADRERSIPDICRELGDIPSSTLYYYVHADGTLKGPGERLLTS